MSASPSGSEKCPEASTPAASPTSTSTSGTGSPATGARFGTVTSKLDSADRPSGSVAVTVSVALPCDTASTLTVLPDTETRATPVSDDLAV